MDTIPNTYHIHIKVFMTTALVGAIMVKQLKMYYILVSTVHRMDTYLIRNLSNKIDNLGHKVFILSQSC